MYRAFEVADGQRDMVGTDSFRWWSHTLFLVSSPYLGWHMAVPVLGGVFRGPSPRVRHGHLYQRCLRLDLLTYDCGGECRGALLPFGRARFLDTYVPGALCFPFCGSARTTTEPYCIRCARKAVQAEQTRCRSASSILELIREMLWLPVDAGVGRSTKG